jgi:hypothetical protein
MHPKEALVTVEKALPKKDGLIEANRLEDEQESEGDPRLCQDFLFRLVNLRTIVKCIIREVPLNTRRTF